MRARTLLPVALAALPTASAGNGTVKCPVVFDGRIPATLALTDFDTSGKGSPYGTDYVKNLNIKWSEILLFPSGPSSRFDNASQKAVEVTLSDKSIFQQQKGFRRAGLQFNGDSNNGSPGWGTGIKTLHFSVKQDAQRALNLSHEYLTVWHEAADYSSDQIMFQTGTMIDQKSLPKDTFKVMGRKNNQIWSTPMDKTEWQNFAFQLDFGKNTVQIYYSKGDEALKSVTQAVADDLTGAGQFQIGMLKKPTGTSDVVNSGYQESGIKEGQIYGGIFVEDSAGGCISL